MDWLLFGLVAWTALMLTITLVLTIIGRDR